MPQRDKIIISTQLFVCICLLDILVNPFL